MALLRTVFCCGLGPAGVRRRPRPSTLTASLVSTASAPTFATQALPAEPTVTAPDGSDVRVLLSLAGGSMAHFSLAAGAVSGAVTHRTVEEIWFVVSGAGRMWRKQEGKGASKEEIVELSPGTCLTIPRGTHFQFRAAEHQPLAAVAITMPPWPGEGEAVAVTGPWPSSQAMARLTGNYKRGNERVAGRHHRNRG
jgi:mannose-6-phosphate isomerase-like protein (cupin superfamily)